MERNSILILSDGKKGHLNQSIAVAELSPLPVKKIVDVHYKSKLSRVLCAIFIYFPRFKSTCKFLLELLLKRPSAQELLRSPARAIISAGSSLHAVNLALAKIHGAKSIVLMKPPWGRQNRYDLRIIPQHDNPTRQKNTVITLGAPTLMGDMDLKTAAQNLKKLFPNFNRPLISLFVGGDTRTHKLTTLVLDDVIKKIKAVCESTNRGILVTSSRRTAPPIRELLKEKFSNDDRCPLLILPTEEAPSQPPDLIAGMMGCSDLLLVTEDSVSMISEAASSGKKVIVIEVTQTQKRGSKHRRLIKGLLRGGYISLARSNELDRQMLEKLSDPTPPKVLRDSIEIRRALETLL